MKTRRDFLKAALGAALVVPAVTACRTVRPEPATFQDLIDLDDLDPNDPTRWARSHDETYHFEGEPLSLDGRAYAVSYHPDGSVLYYEWKTGPWPTGRQLERYMKS